MFPKRIPVGRQHCQRQLFSVKFEKFSHFDGKQFQWNNFFYHFLLQFDIVGPISVCEGLTYVFVADESPPGRAYHWIIAYAIENLWYAAHDELKRTQQSISPVAETRQNKVFCRIHKLHILASVPLKSFQRSRITAEEVRVRPRLNNLWTMWKMAISPSHCV